MDAKTRLDALAGLRLAAAAVVAVGHMPFLIADERFGPAARRVLAEGVYGLTFFFVLSGFVLAYTYHDRLANPTRRELGRYYLARLARIWPVHLLALAVVLALPIGTPTGTGHLAANALLVHAWVPSVSFASSYNALSWTLSIELFFYLVTPLLLFAAARTDRRLVLVAVLAWLVPAALALLLRNRGAAGVYVCVFCPLVRLGEFAIGVVLGLAFVKGGPSVRGSRFWTALEVLSVALMLALILCCHRVPLLFRMNGYYTPAAALVVYCFARQRGVLSRVLGSRAAVYLSDLSFAFYMLHGVAFHHLGPRFGPGWDPLARAAAQVGLVGLLAAVVHHAFEVPVRAAILRIGRRRPPDVVGPVRVEAHAGGQAARATPDDVTASSAGCPAASAAIGSAAAP